MNINRNNYEEYFILYMDNELSREERRQVEALVQLHPDLKEELELLMQYKLVPDADILFTGKEELLKGADNGLINLTNYDEWFTVYADNELTKNEKTAVEHFIADNQPLERELLLTQKAKLRPEEIVFENKESLYRKEDKVKLIPLNWWRVAAAVILLLGISFAIYSVVSKKPAPGKDEGLAKTQEQINDAKKSIDLTKEKDTPVSNPLAVDDNKNETKSLPEKIVNKSLNSLANKQNTPEEKRENAVLPAMKEQAPLVVDNNNKGSNHLPQPLNNPNVKNDALAVNDIKKEKVNTSSSLNEYVTNNPSASSSIKQAAFKDVSVFDQDDNKNNKIRGFFRKLTRTLEKRTNIDATDDDDKLLVAGLAIKLK